MSYSGNEARAFWSLRLNQSCQCFSGSLGIVSGFSRVTTHNESPLAGRYNSILSYCLSYIPLQDISRKPAIRRTSAAVQRSSSPSRSVHGRPSVVHATADVSRDPQPSNRASMDFQVCQQLCQDFFGWTNFNPQALPCLLTNSTMFPQLRPIKVNTPPLGPSRNMDVFQNPGSQAKRDQVDTHTCCVTSQIFPTLGAPLKNFLLGLLIYDHSFFLLNDSKTSNDQRFHPRKKKRTPYFE